MYKNYATMYDQYKLNAVRVGMEMTYISNQLLNSATFPSVCTAWDRNGIRPNVVNVKVDGNEENDIKAFQLPTYDTTASYSSANEKTLYYGSRWGIVRQLDAASMMEKSVYVGTLNTKDILTNDNLYNCWSPALLMSLKCPRPVSGASQVIFQLHYQFDVTLRGLRKVVLDDTQFNTMLKPNDWFMGYRPDNCGYAILKPNVSPVSVGAYAIVPLISDGQATPDATAAAKPTINPNANIDVNPYTNTGIYMPSGGQANDNLKL